MPSSWRHRRITSGALSGVTPNPGTAAAARSVNSSTASPRPARLRPDGPPSPPTSPSLPPPVITRLLRLAGQRATNGGEIVITAQRFRKQEANRKDAVDRLVLVSGTMSQDGSYPEVVVAFNQLEGKAAMIGGSVKTSPLGKAYPDVDWTNLFRKVGELTKQPFDWSADVVKVRARTMLVFADADSIRPEHMVEFWKALGGGRRDAGIDGSLRPANQFAIVPNTTHYTIPVEPMLPKIVERFLATA